MLKSNLLFTALTLAIGVAAASPAIAAVQTNPYKGCFFYDSSEAILLDYNLHVRSLCEHFPLCPYITLIDESRGNRPWFSVVCRLVPKVNDSGSSLAYSQLP